MRISKYTQLTDYAWLKQKYVAMAKNVHVTFSELSPMKKFFLSTENGIQKRMASKNSFQKTLFWTGKPFFIGSWMTDRRLFVQEEKLPRL
jgi:hypothetical protein